MTCVCVSCAIEDQHRLHNMKTFSTAHKELLEKLSAEQQDLQVKTAKKNLSLEKWEKSEREKLARSSVRLIEAVTNLRDIALTSVHSSVSARMVSIKTSKSSMQAAQKEKDTFRFLQMYSQVQQDMEKAKAVDLRKGMEPGSDRDKLVQDIKQNGEKMVEQAGHFWGSLLSLVDPENHQELINTSSDLIFEPQSLGPSMSLSKDRRKVFYTGLEPYSATLLIRSTRSTPKFQRWVVSLSCPDWTIGLCDKQFAQNLTYGHVYGLCRKDNRLSSLTTARDDGSWQQRTLRPLITQLKNGDESVPRPGVVEVFLNSDASSLSFFSKTGRHQREEIITIKMSLNNCDLAPFVHVAKTNAQNILQQQWKCHCRQVNYTGSMLWQMKDKQFYNSFQSNCSCGAYIGDECITEVVCELQ
ncbi:uncharacterized protein si:dkey-183c6.9 [Epinephelus fuscoguttatus]|uniref:uncharacterized protein si:dkey-183c6.9 n=1 Tax=Epinephelus fuscoguttatus TaxID=293821 RepID=UPI0020D12BA9|nr:uncharacterized protein si:dkey-183c6.9 [Epinephelus fuscoguttatus]